MSKKKPVIISLPGVIFSAVLIAFLLFIIQRESAPLEDSPSKARLMLEPPSEKSVSGSIPWYKTEELTPMGSAAVIQRIKDGRIHLLFELRRLQDAFCIQPKTTTECQDEIFAYIDSIAEPASSNLRQYYQDYIRFENSQGEIIFTNDMDFITRYELMKQKRRDIMGQESANMVFGLDEALFEYQIELHNIMTGELELVSADRLAEFEARKKELLGPYYTAITSQEDRNVRYGLELAVAQGELEAMDPEMQQQRIAEIQAKHFDKQQIEEMQKKQAEYNTKLDSREELMNLYLQKEQEFNAANPNLSVEERRKALDDIRSDIFSEQEMADFSLSQ
jgi:hypothetical protein